MKAKLIGSLLFLLTFALVLTISARPSRNPKSTSADVKADRDDQDRDNRDRDDQGPQCVNDENLASAKNTPVHVVGVIPIPGAPLVQSDIIWADPITEKVYWSDRSNASLDIFDAEQNVFWNRVPGFTGLNPAGGGTTATNDRGPNGVLTLPSGFALVGDGNSSVEVVQLNPSKPGYLTIVQTINTNIPVCDSGSTSPSSGHYCERTDELGYDPADHLVLVQNDEPQDVNAPHNPITPYGSWIDVSSFPFKVVGQVLYPNAGGAEQAVWDALLQRFILTLPGTAASAGPPAVPFEQSRIAIIKPLAKSPERYIGLGDMTGVATCSTANGLALGTNQHALASACNGAIVFNALTGKLINFITSATGGDEVWANLGDDRFYFSGTDNLSTATPKPTALGVIDMQSGQLLQLLDANGTQNPTAFAETNTIFAAVHTNFKAATTTTPAVPDTTVCAQYGDANTGCVVIYKHDGADPDDLKN